MALYTVHVPETAGDGFARGEATVLVREGFSPSACLFGFCYLVWHRLWAAMVAYAVLVAAIAALAIVMHPPLIGLVALLVLMHLYLGAEGPDLRRWDLARRGLALRDIVSAPDLETAERLFFTRQPAWPAAVPSRPHRAAWHNRGATPAVIGLFPEGDGT
ncbi:DUF2628 domain-containing protein [Lichenihabitans sp. Uapishka_5]|uniref:DUF2628 domain-containing protein n=1 Tax=Lichenihabitans sp. Uapishka_5 TaxID=3037302 RepID=UPI0029E8289E|nr:DUF2628 domain-containing protein [Lichenihabitans sp. Uapishka_5]MDX7950726.1 DUF2628 domain-containing protein [Lichenihabitans sp. Uapishka_5]